MSSLSFVFNIVTLVFSVICLALFIVGAIGFAEQRDVIRNVSWITSTETDNIDIFYGLRKAYASINGVHVAQAYDDDSCTADYCDACEQDGLAAFGLLIIALFFSALNILLSTSLLFTFNASRQIANVFVSFAAACTSLIAIGFFMGDCYNLIDQDQDDNAGDLSWGPGSILTIIGMGLMWTIVVMQIVASAVGSEVTASTAGNSGSGKSTNRFN
jgi:hypothetical protein